MKKITLAVLALTLVCFSFVMGCKKEEAPAPAQDQQTQPAEQGKEAPAEKK